MRRFANESHEESISSETTNINGSWQWANRARYDILTKTDPKRIKKAKEYIYIYKCDRLWEIYHLMSGLRENSTFSFCNHETTHQKRMKNDDQQKAEEAKRPMHQCQSIYYE